MCAWCMYTNVFDDEKKQIKFLEEITQVVVKAYVARNLSIERKEERIQEMQIILVQLLTYFIKKKKKSFWYPSQFQVFLWVARMKDLQKSKTIADIEITEMHFDHAQYKHFTHATHLIT